MSLYLISFASIIFTCIFLDKISNKLGVPTLLAFLILGLLVGWSTNIDSSHYPLAESICNIALLLIIFYGGFGVRWESAKPIVREASLLASAGVVITILVTATICRFLLEMPWNESLLISSIMGSTDAASVFSILRSRKLGLQNNTTPMLEMESGSNDPFAYIMTILILQLFTSTEGISFWGTIWLLFKQVTFGLAIGYIVAKTSIYLLKKYPIPSSGMSSLYIMAIALVAYALPGLFDGNGFLSVYIAGVILGNFHMKDKKELVHFFDGIVTLTQIILFYFLGLLAKADALLDSIVPAIIILVVVTLISRPLAVHSILLLFRNPNNKKKCLYTVQQRNFISFVGLRGAASIVFVITAISHIISNELAEQGLINANLVDHIYDIIFCIVVLSISIQGGLIPFIAKKLDVIDKTVDVMTTFNDFTDSSDMQFNKLEITANSSWCGQKIADIDIPKNLIMALIIRGDDRILPKGRVTLECGDIVIIGMKSWDIEDGLNIHEYKVSAKDKWCNLLIKEYPRHHDEVILMISRNGDTVIPTGKTKILENDILMILATNENQAIKSI